MQAPHPSWGECQSTLVLPSLSITFDGLSSSQKTSIDTAYAGFLDTASRNSDSPSYRCQALRLASPIEEAPSEFSYRHLYAPRFSRIGPGQFTITGLNFDASLDTRPVLRRSTLGVYREQELAQSNVIENYLRMLCAREALSQGGILLHSAAVVVDGEALLFVGQSNAGKTTLSRKAHEEGATVLSDDINLVSFSNGRAFAHAVPFTGEFGRTLSQPSEAASHPVHAVMSLRQGTECSVEQLAPAAGFAALVANAPFVNIYPELADSLDNIIERAISAAPLRRLTSERDTPFSTITAAIENSLDTKL